MATATHPEPATLTRELRLSGPDGARTVPVGAAVTIVRRRADDDSLYITGDGIPGQALVDTGAVAVLVSIGHDKGRPDADADTIHGQVDRWTWIGMGACMFLGHRDGLQADISLGAGRRKRRLYIKLNAADLYDVELGQVHGIRAAVPYSIVEQLHDVDAENLDRALRDLYDRHL